MTLPDRKPEKRKPLTWAELPEEEKKRLRDREAAQRRETKKRGLPAVSVSVEGLWLIQGGCCACDQCRCEVPLVPGKIAIAHRHFRAGKGSPGHMPHNVQLWIDDCNAREAPKRKSSIQSRGFQKKPKNYVSPLSRESKGYKKRTLS